MLGRSLLLHLADNKQIESFVRGNRWSARASRRFVAGETLDEAISSVRALTGQGISASLDLLGESVRSREQVAETVDYYLRVFQAIRENSLDCNVSLKLTALGLDIDEELCYRSEEHTS